MNKRIQKKKEKQQEVKIPKGYGLIIGNGDGINHKYIKHHHPIDSLVKIVSIDQYSAICELDGLTQSVSKEHVTVGN